MATIGALNIEVCSVIVHDEMYKESRQWDDLSRRCVIGYRVRVNSDTTGAGAGSAFSAVVSIADFLASGFDKSDILIADDITFSILQELDNKCYNFFIKELDIQIQCNKNQLVAFLIELSGEIMQAAKQLGFDLAKHVYLHMSSL